MKRHAVMALLALSTLAACGPRGCVPPRAPSTAADAGGRPADGGARAACDPSTDAWGCCCFTATNAIVCPPGAPVPDAAVLTLPDCDPK